MKSAIFALFALTISIASAQQPSQPTVRTYQTRCDNTVIILNSLKQQYGELPLIAGNSDSQDATGVMIMTVNPGTKSWTIIVVHNDLTCIIGGGKNFTVRGEGRSTL